MLSQNFLNVQKTPVHFTQVIYGSYPFTGRGACDAVI